MTPICGRHGLLDGGGVHGGVVLFDGRGQTLVCKVAFVALDLGIVSLAALLLESVFSVNWGHKSV